MNETHQDENHSDCVADQHCELDEDEDIPPLDDIPPLEDIAEFPDLPRDAAYYLKLDEQTRNSSATSIGERSADLAFSLIQIQEQFWLDCEKYRRYKAALWASASRPSLERRQSRFDCSACPYDNPKICPEFDTPLLAIDTNFVLKNHKKFQTDGESIERNWAMLTLPYTTTEMGPSISFDVVWPVRTTSREKKDEKKKVAVNFANVQHP
ncbi:hypothetical protein FB451DRAFT_1175519 [Mycena latifolia]|nr:hypothetical protein FB451DRAFT_1175519 [Mycena latifolia]